LRRWFPTGSDAALATKLYRGFNAHPDFSATKKMRSSKGFVAGGVHINH